MHGLFSAHSSLARTSPVPCPLQSDWETRGSEGPLGDTGFSAVTMLPFSTGTQPCRPSLCSSNTPHAFLPLGLCTSCSLCLDARVPDVTWLAQMPLPWRGLSWRPKVATPSLTPAYFNSLLKQPLLCHVWGHLSPINRLYAHSMRETDHLSPCPIDVQNISPSAHQP